MWSDSSGGPVSCRAAQVTVSAQGLSGTIAYLGKENRLESAPEQTRVRTEDKVRTAQPQTSQPCELAVPYHCAGL